MMRVQPALERAKLFLQFENPLRVDDGRVDLEPVADDARIRQQAGAIRLAVQLRPSGYQNHRRRGGSCPLF